ncbi:MAG TPA: hypothetical protein VGF99_16095 [Myxococcota bacterium]
MTSSSSSSSAALPVSPAVERLQAVLLEANALGPADLRTRLMWIEKAAAAADAVALEADDDDINSGALHLRASLGAIVKWSQGDKAPDTLVELDAIVRTLLTRAQLGLLRGLAGIYDALVDERAPQRATCAALRDALLAFAKHVEKGTPPPASLQQQFSEILRAAST